MVINNISKIRFIALILFQTMTLTIHAADDNNSKPKENNEYLLLEKLNDISDERKTLKSEVQELSEYLNIVENELAEIKSLKFNTVAADTNLQSIKKAVNNLAKLPANTELNNRNPDIATFINSYRTIVYDILDASYGNYKNILDLSRTSENGRNTIVQPIIKRLINASGLENQNSTYIDKLSNLYDDIDRDRASFRTSDIYASTNLVKAKLDNLTTDDLKKLFESRNTSLISSIGKIVDGLQNEISSRNDKDKQLGLDYADISSNLADLQKDKASVDEKLIYAVYMMICVLFLMFISLRIFNFEVATNIIRKRSLVEVVGMAFMLITIIILGTGNKINAETLGTLLGTIAGYIFGRIGAERTQTE